MQIFIQEVKITDEIIDLSRFGHEYHQTKYPGIFKSFNTEVARNDITKILEENIGISFIAKNENQNIGYILCRKKNIPENEYRFGYSVLFIEQLAVNPEYRKNGVAQKLIDHVIIKATELKIDKIELNCWAGNIEALRLYEKNNFKEIRIVFERMI